VLALLGFIRIQTRQDEESAFQRRDPPRWHHFLAVFDDASRYGELLKHEGGERHASGAFDLFFYPS
jgi:hypothetical protein